MEDKPDFGATTAVFAYVRKRVTPKVLWSAIGTLVTALAVCITWLVTTQARIVKTEESIQRHEESIKALQKQGDVNEINTKLAVLTSKMTDISAEVERLREWRDRIEDVASSPPHARRKK